MVYGMALCDIYEIISDNEGEEIFIQYDNQRKKWRGENINNGSEKIMAAMNENNEKKSEGEKRSEKAKKGGRKWNNESNINNSDMEKKKKKNNNV